MSNWGSFYALSRFLDEHPEYTNQGITLTQFSFQIPRPMQENYVRKRPARAAPSNDAGDIGMSASQGNLKFHLTLIALYFRNCEPQKPRKEVVINCLRWLSDL